MSNKPQLAIVMPVFRNHHDLQEAAQSIIGQSVPENFPIELVIVEDSSNDGNRTWNKILEVERRIKTERSSIQVTTIKRARNDGQSFARLIGVSKTDSPWICYLDVDDIYDRDFIKNISRHINEFAGPDTDLILCNYKITDTKNNSIIIHSPKDICGDSPALAAENEHICDSIGIVHSRKLYNRIGGWPPFLLSGEDDVFVRRLINSSKNIEFSEHFCGTKFVSPQGQGVCKRRFDSGLYIMLNKEHVDGANGQYLDDTPASEFFIDTATDTEYERRNLNMYTYSLVRPRNI